MENQILDNDLRNGKMDDSLHSFYMKPNEQRSKIILALIWIVLSIEIISIFSSVMQYNLLQAVTNGAELSDETATANDLREWIIGIIYLIAYTASGIAFIMWFRRAYFNLHQLVKSLSFTDGWAAGSWFVPIVNLYRPYQIMKELYVETKNHLSGKNESSQEELTTNYLGMWWTMWIINGILGQIIFRISKHAETIQELKTLTILSIISGVIGVGLAFITIKIIKDYSDVERSLI